MQLQEDEMTDNSESDLGNGSPNADTSLSHYWSQNLKLIGGCLVVWFTVSFGFAIILRPYLADIKIGGTDLGFWFAQQGSILFFLAIIFFYAWRMNKIDHDHNVDDD